jgi:hypothetical protein
MVDVETVLDAGPIPYSDILLFGDPDLEHGLRHVGLEPMETSYRLIEIPLTAIGDVQGMSRWQSMGRSYIDRVREGVEFPPLVVMPTSSGWTLLDGVNRAYAYWTLGQKRVVAYDLIDASRHYR